MGDPRPPAASGGLLAAALADLRVDFDQLLSLCRSAEADLEAAEVELGAVALHEATRELLARQRLSSRRRYRAAGERLQSLRALAAEGAPSPSLVGELATEKRSLADLLRAEQALLAALVGAADWQSPSFLHSTLPAAGRQCGRIRPHWNDYKRDRHLDADAYERRYLRAMVDGPAGLRALLTSCGMAAFTTVLSFLQLERRLERPVLAGAGLYHESRLLLEKALPGRVQLVDEGDNGALLRSIDELRPSAVFLDSLSNTKWMPVPDLAAVLERLRGSDTYLVVDNTGLSVACQPFALAGGPVRLIVFESLLKYAQLGLDRANAGVIVARRGDAELLAGYREHLGTNVADVAVHALPRPDRPVLMRRLARLQRNALILAERLGEQAQGSVEIVYPGLPGHPCARASRRLSFRGGCLSIVFRGTDASLRRERALVEAAVAEAARRGIALLAGSSFGFDTTRIYLTAARAECGEPFVRVAAGSEHRLELETLAAALAAAVQRVGE
ncbi:Cystathionine beta-lyase/cystathionine gamma-synthase [Gaiella occulta]|uniref:Cystathionine beta-lyase/cystathionine gamma-synthase n=1 Tax=Gaiella occulta TaxID=1002870 RepID=A0A7M2YWR5_9ACTN|nr:Cystathionine beta-lyase/cystathionine gamma-synthase [Gaiella occulta]